MSTHDLICPTPHLPETSHPYRIGRMRRPGADPIGLTGLPDRRCDLDNLLRRLCCELLAAGGHWRRGRRLVATLGLRGTRTLRQLAAYGHVHHRIRAILGVPGHGYCWGAIAGRAAYRRASCHAARMGRDWFFLATLYGRAAPAVQVAQLMFGFAAGPGGGQQPDELASLLASHQVGPEQLADAMIQVLREAPGGAAILRRLGRRHADLLLSERRAAILRGHLHDALATLDSTPVSAGSPAAIPP